MPLALFASGFNAHGQLSGERVEDHPGDLRQLQCILTAESDIRVLYLGWGETLLLVDDKLVLRGCSTSSSKGLGGEVNCNDVSPFKIISSFGDEAGLQGVLTDEGEVLFLDGEVTGEVDSGGSLCLRRRAVASLDEEKQKHGGEPLRHLAVAGNGKVCISFDSTIIEYPSLTSLLAGSSHSAPTKHTLPAPPLQLLPGETSFTALVSDPGRSIYTWGDGRHNHLGRTLTPNTPSTIPHLVDHLGGIPVKKIATAGWITAAVSMSHDLYIWGGRPGEEDRINDLPDVSRRPEDEAEVSLVDIEGGVDVIDVAVGWGHIVVLTADGRLWAVGRNDNGQLGCANAADGKKFADDWQPVQLAADTGTQIQELESVHCGPCSSLVVVRTE